VASGCESNDPPDWPSVYRISGTITSATSAAPVPGAEFALRWSAGAFGDGGAVTESDENGHYHFERDWLAPVDCEAFAIVVSAAGYGQVIRDPGGVRCTSEVQRFDFALVPVP
jgi:hypothetical protein